MQLAISFELHMARMFVVIAYLRLCIARAANRVIIETCRMQSNRVLLWGRSATLTLCWISRGFSYTSMQVLTYFHI